MADEPEVKVTLDAEIEGYERSLQYALDNGASPDGQMVKIYRTMIAQLKALKENNEQSNMR